MSTAEHFVHHPRVPALASTTHYCCALVWICLSHQLVVSTVYDVDLSWLFAWTFSFLPSTRLLLRRLPSLSSSPELWNYLDFHFVLDSIFCQGFRRDDWFVASGKVELPQAFQWDLRGLVCYFLEDVVVCTLPHPCAQTYCPDEDDDLLSALDSQLLQCFV